MKKNYFFSIRKLTIKHFITKLVERMRVEGRRSFLHIAEEKEEKSLANHLSKPRSITNLKQQLRKCRVPQALAHSAPQLSQLIATGLVDPNSQIATPEYKNKSKISCKFNVRLMF